MHTTLAAPANLLTLMIPLLSLPGIATRLDVFSFLLSMHTFCAPPGPLLHFVQLEELADASAAPEENLQSLPTRQYLDRTVVPLLLEGITALSKERYDPPHLDFRMDTKALLFRRLALLTHHINCLSTSIIAWCYFCHFSLLSCSLHPCSSFHRPPKPIEWLASYLLKSKDKAPYNTAASSTAAPVEPQ
jgi:hypothetical protein